VDDKGDYSREVHFQVNVQSRGVKLEWDPASERSYAGGSILPSLIVRPMEETTGTAGVEVYEKPTDWIVGLPSTEEELRPGVSKSHTVAVTVAPATPIGQHKLIVRAWMKDAPLIQSFAVLEVNVTEKWPDLQVTHVELRPARPSEGEVAGINFSVRNTGHVPATSFDIELVYNRLGDGPDGNNSSVVLYRHHTYELATGAALDFEVPWDTSLGIHEFVVLADIKGNNSDLVPEDNIRSIVYLLEGHDVELTTPVQQFDVEPGDEVNITLTVTNVGNLFDLIRLRVVENTHHWSRAFDLEVVRLDPGASQEVVLMVLVPDHALGGVEGRITVEASSLNSPLKQANVTLSLVIPEVFGLNVSKDKSSILVSHLGTESFNITIENSGNGMETYTIDYVPQTEDLLVSAVNDSIELAPGCSTLVEVFVSGLGTPVGGQTFLHRFTIRSNDDPATVESVQLIVNIEKVSGLSAHVKEGTYSVHPGGTMYVTLSVTNEGNHNMSVEAWLSGPAALFNLRQLLTVEVVPGMAHEYPFFLAVHPEVTMGEYTMVINVSQMEGVDPFVTVEVPVTVERVDAHSFSYNSSTNGSLSPGGIWNATLVLYNNGNHLETYVLNVSGAPKWMSALLSSDEIVLPAYGESSIELTVTLIGDDMEAPESIILAITATPANATGAVPTVVLDVPLDIEVREGPGSTWLMWVTMALVILVLIVTLALFRKRR
jgi:uncharacterized membrane protein